MLKDKDYRELENAISRIYSDIETSLVRRICRWLRMNPGGTLDPEDWRLRKLSGLGVMQVDIRNLLVEESAQNEAKIIEAVSKAVETNSKSDLKLYQAILEYKKQDKSLVLKVAASEIQKNRIEGVIKNARKALNMTNTLALEASQQCFLDSVNSAYLRVMEGAYTLDDAVWYASKALARKGLTIATYNGPTATNISMDAAVRRNVVTSVAQATAEMSKGMAQDLGLDLVQTSAHIGARPQHQVWQGKVFSLSGKSDKYPALSAPQEAGGTGYGTAEGLCGCNCRHHFFPYAEGFKPTDYGIDISPAENEEIYNATQKQRLYERNIRSWKRTEKVAEDNGKSHDIKTARERIRGYQKALRELCDKYNLPREYARERV